MVSAVSLLRAAPPTPAPATIASVVRCRDVRTPLARAGTPSAAARANAPIAPKRTRNESVASFTPSATRIGSVARISTAVVATTRVDHIESTHHSNTSNAEVAAAMSTWAITRSKTQLNE